MSFGHSDVASIFIRDPDRNVIELRGNIEGGEQIEGLEVRPGCLIHLSCIDPHVVVLELPQYCLR
ncbi:MAG: hypothetical protein CM1200mP18_22450 [Gammaproteobacteria bacterium]|nr:MAG: hypothetical protein CM1200mP18_22450 [Gammaproteobacteria bacterium]